MIGTGADINFLKSDNLEKTWPFVHDGTVQVKSGSVIQTMGTVKAFMDEGSVRTYSMEQSPS